MQNDLIKKVVIGTALGFILGFGSAWIYLDKSIDTVAGNKTKNERVVEDSNTGEEEILSSPIVIDEQVPGDKVLVKKAELASDSWVVIYEDNDGELGRILGARLFSKGLSEGREVFLLRSTESGRRYYALIHAESGDGDFDYKDDVAVSDSTGERLLITSFLVQ